MNEQAEQPNAEMPDVSNGFGSLKDNMKDNSLIPVEHQLSDEILGLLRHFSGKKLNDVKSEEATSEGLVIIGPVNALKEDDAIFELKEDTAKQEGLLVKKYTLQTHNIMGVFTLRHGGAQFRLQITSRFDTSKKQPFLCWMLERVLRVTLSELIDTKKDSSFWTILLELLFWKRLGEAASVGLYRQYQRFEYNDLRFRGRLDIDRHIRLNMPLWDKIAYSRREITYDNPINHLLRHASKIVLSHWQDAIIGGQDNKNSLDMVSAIEANTPTWSQGNLRDLLLEKDLLQAINHPYYAEYYEELRILALCIVLGHGVDLYTNSNPDDFSINGILFDGAWLWEEYLNTILAEEGFWHAVPMNNTLPIYALQKAGNVWRPLFPDFRLPDGNSEQHATVILDAKYKRGDKTDGLAVRRADMHQCLCYMLLTGAIAGGVIYPPYLQKEEFDNDVEDEDKDFLEVRSPGPKRYWRCFTFEQVDNCAEEAFAEKMRLNEEKLRNFVRDMKSQAKIESQK